MLALELAIVAAVVALAAGMVVAVSRGGRTRSAAGAGSGALAGILVFGLVACLGAAFLMLFAFPDRSPLAALYAPTCDAGKRAALRDLPPHRGIVPSFDDMADGCVGFLPFSGDPADARAHYAERLAERGWSVSTPGPRDRWAGALVSAVRGDYRLVVDYDVPPTPPAAPGPVGEDPDGEIDAQRHLTFYMVDW